MNHHVLAKAFRSIIHRNSLQNQEGFEHVAQKPHHMVFLGLWIVPCVSDTQASPDLRTCQFTLTRRHLNTTASECGQSTGDESWQSVAQGLGDSWIDGTKACQTLIIALTLHLQESKLGAGIAPVAAKSHNEFHDLEHLSECLEACGLASSRQSCLHRICPCPA